MLKERTAIGVDDLVVSVLSEIRAEYNLFDTKDEPKYRALSTAIEAINAQRWIPCSERLPDESKWYIISNGLDSWVAIWSKENKEWLSVTGLDYTITDVIAWMEFPEPYRLVSVDEITHVAT